MSKSKHRHVRAGRGMPAQQPASSKQDYGTPRGFLDATRRLLMINDFVIDLAATSKNRVCPAYFSRIDNSLARDWHKVCGAQAHNTVDPAGSWGWLNHPFGDSDEWIEYAHNQANHGAQLVQLTPAAVGTNYWREFVHNKAHVLFLSPRIQFVGSPDSYIKDLALLVWNGDAIASDLFPVKVLEGGTGTKHDLASYNCWDWLRGRIY